MKRLRHNALQAGPALLALGVAASLLSSCSAAVQSTDLTSVGEIHVAAEELHEAIDLPDRGGTFEEWIPYEPSRGNPPDEGTLIYRTCDGETLELAAVIMDGDPPRGNQGERLDLPVSSEEETWEFLGLVKSGVVMARTSTDRDQLDVVVVNVDGQHLLHTLPGDAEVPIPGAVRP